ncbi:hypothetical protein BFP97_15875 [Roseivirga sp. 4D4]|uniref:DUF4382 domain-containing protein n=1 Tax=Roseivirga sp. 4D4 TaxID=1889784 RepID=UPI0008531A15|nr:DUF4382 domain-containing protein [Roseivirga sp. 4D4]OEK02911.1 hypothetical protein BFP97_15875 [Roseivirga sp. 4D4]
MKTLKTLKFALIGVLALTFSSCGNDDEVDGSGQASIEVTDAPIDNTEVQGVFVTITDVKINGQSASSFDGKTTVDLLALQNGRTEILANEELDAGTYNSITFTLDLATDASGNTPGSYVMTSSGKQALEMEGQSEVDLIATGSYNILANSSNALVVDFDLRKMIQEETNGADDYTFVTRAEANAALRLVEKRVTGSIVGQVDMDDFDDADKVIVYAYKEGTFNRETETSGQGSSNVMFANAVSSTAIAEGAISDRFELNFMEAGNYELVYAAYSENTLTGELEFESFIETSAGAEGEITDVVAVEANVQLNLSLIFSAMID